MDQNGIKNQLDIVIKTTKHDLLPFMQLQKDIIRNSSLNGKVYVIVSKVDYPLFRSNTESKFVLVSTEDILRKLGFSEDFEDNWYTQQLVKLCTYSLLEGEAYLVLDSNTLINSKFNRESFLFMYKYVYCSGQCSNRDIIWESNSLEFLGQKDRCPIGFRAVNQIFIKRVVRNLFLFLENLYNSPVVDTLLAACRRAYRKKEPEWTEYAIYGSYAYYISLFSNHIFCRREDIWYYNHKRYSHKFDRMLQEIAIKRPFMIKLYKRRPGFVLPDAEYLDIVRKKKMLTNKLRNYNKIFY